MATPKTAELVFNILQMPRIRYLLSLKSQGSCGRGALKRGRYHEMSDRHSTEIKPRSRDIGVTLNDHRQRRAISPSTSTPPLLWAGVFHIDRAGEDHFQQVSDCKVQVSLIWLRSGVRHKTHRRSETQALL